ncbi:MAG: response regulator [Parcubacteria group bacterium]
MKKILFIEDESALQKTFGDLLEAKGYRLVSALDGEIGLALAKKEKPDLILLDIILPKINGLEIMGKLKADPETKAIPIIILTNLESVNNVGKALELGATTYLVKAQYSLDEILEKIEKALSN